jgi:hypothetical protein
MAFYMLLPVLEIEGFAAPNGVYSGSAGGFVLDARPRLRNKKICVPGRLLRGREE